MAVADVRAPEVRDWMRELYDSGVVAKLGRANAMRVRAERSPEQRENLATFLRGLRAAEGRLAKLGEGEDVKATPDWRRWAVVVGGVTVAHLPRGAKEVAWTADGLVRLKASTGAEIMAELPVGQ